MSIGPIGTHVFDALDPAALRARHSNKWSLWNEPVLPAWVADMDFPVADPIRDAVASAVAMSDWCYPPEALRAEFAAAGCDWMRRRHGYDADPALALLLNDVVQGLQLILHSMSARADHVIVHTPSYPPFLESIDELNRVVAVSPMVLGERFEIDLDELARLAAQAEILILCNPQNPTGRVFSPDELLAIGEIAIEHDLVVISDEIWADLLAPGHRHVSFASLSPEIAARTITLISPSKPFNTAGLRAALMIFGTAALKERVMKHTPSHLLGTINNAGLLGGIAAYTKCDSWLADTNEYLDVNRRYVAARISSDMPMIRHVPGEATYVAWLDCSALPVDDDARYWFVKHALVGGNDGKKFGPEFGGCTRLNFATSRPILTEIMDRMARAVAAVV